ncbi:MAG: 50S ribosomal protein L3 [Pelagibacteraceae bacterium]|nr:50S ribosomal protein L3 [Pelagibacteraceae bacterium]
MIKRSGLIGTKMGNSSYYDESGKSLPVTILKISDCIVSDVKTIEKNGYSSVQLASIDGKKDVKKLKKPQQKLFANLKINPKKIIKEFRVNQENILEIGSNLDVTHFKQYQFVDVTSTSIGKGFAGAMKRHNFGGLRASHGVSVSHRSHGSTGQNQDPGKVFKGKKMAGHMGATQVTIQNLKVVEVDEENSLLILKGSVPGKKNSIIFIKDAVKKS